MSKKFLFLISLIVFINSINIVFAEIIPIKKPSQTEEIKKKKLLIDTMRPLPKPLVKKVIKEKKEKETEEKASRLRRRTDEFSLYRCSESCSWNYWESSYG